MEIFSLPFSGFSLHHNNISPLPQLPKFAFLLLH